MIRLIFATALILATATAGTITLAPVSDGLGTIGEDSDFKVYSGTVTNSSVQLFFNYRAPNGTAPVDALGGYTDFGSVLNVGDLLFTVGSNNYGLVLHDHSGAPNGGDASLFPTVLAGHFYSSTSLLTAQTVLNNPGGVTYRNNTNVWLGSNVTDLGTLAETILSPASTGPAEYEVDFAGNLPAQFLADITAQGGVQATFSSATCGNGELTGGGTGTLGSPTPEPMSLMLMGSGLAGLGLLRFRKKSQKQ